MKTNKFKNECKSLFKTATNLIYPPQCICCHNPPINSYYPICSSCLFSISPFSADLKELSTIKHPQLSKMGKAITLGEHKDVLRKVILAFKQRNNMAAGTFLSYILANIIPVDWHTADFITYVPSSNRSLKKRGFNPPQIIATTISQVCGIKLNLNILKKVKNTKKQALLSQVQRINNVRNAYKVNENLQNTKIIVIDDVLTTGATILSCCNALINKGGKIIGTAFFSYRPLFCTLPLS